MIRFDVVFNRNEVADCIGPCFGWLEATKDTGYRVSKIRTPENEHLAGEFREGKGPQELIWYPDETQVTEEMVKVGWGIIKEILSEIQWLSDVVLARPETRTIHVKLGNTPCDKSILCIGIIRNYFTIKSFQDAYLKAKEAGASVKEAYIFAALVEVSAHWSGEWCGFTRELWEYDAVNSATFGKQALRAMFKPGYSPWKQKTWLGQVGYHREHTLGGTFENLYGDVSRRKLLDTFSVEGDEEILNEQQEISINNIDEAKALVKQIRQAMQA